MDMWKRKAPFQGRELYYYDTNKGFEAEKLAARLYRMLREELEKSGKRRVLFLCIGTDRSTGDSLGPLIGYQLGKSGLKHMQVLGTLSRPVHAMNLEETMYAVRCSCRDCLIVAVDASVGMSSHVGCITLGRGALKPDPLMLQSVRLHTVMRLAECICESVCLVEKLWESVALV